MRKMMILASALFIAAASATAKEASKPSTAPQTAQPRTIAPERLEAAHKLVRVTGAEKLARQMMHTLFPQITDMLVRARPDKKEEITRLMREVGKEMVSAESMTVFTDFIARIYAEEFTTDELRKILAFYNTPVGKKLISRMPAILMRSQQAGRAWGKQMARKAIERIRQKAKERGIDL